MLGTQKKAEQGVIQSSIALLQERFKQLQRVKEMREKRQILQIFSNDIGNPPSSATLSTSNNSSPTITDSTTLLCANNPTDHNNVSNYNNDDASNNKLQVFLPPNYYNYSSSSYQSSSPSSSTSSSSSSLLNNNNNNNRMNNIEDEVSLSLWPPVLPPVTELQSAREMGPTFKLEEAYQSQSQTRSYGSDVDTTLRL